MKKITILLLLMCFLSEFIFAQTYPGTPVSNPVRTYTQNDTKGVWVIGNGAPIFSPTAKMSQLYFDYMNQTGYFWNGSAWVAWTNDFLRTASNGLTEDGTNVKLGGLLTEETTIDLNGNDFIISGTGSLAVDVTGNIQLQTAGTIDLLADGKLQTFTLANMEVYAAQDIAIETDDVINIHAINGGSIIVDNNDFVLEATAGDIQINSPATTAGVVNGITYKSDVSNSVAVTDYGINTTTAGMADDGKVWTYNGTGNEMELQTLPSAIPGLNTIGANQLTSGLWDTITINNWNILGNAGTVQATNFIGTTDAIGFSMRTNNIERLKIDPLGGVSLPISGVNASLPMLTMTGTWYSAGTTVTSKPHFLIEPTGTTSNLWNAVGTGLGVNAASGFAGNIADFQLNGISRVYLSATGNVLNAIGNVQITGTLNVNAIAGLTTVSNNGVFTGSNNTAFTIAGTTANTQSIFNVTKAFTAAGVTTFTGYEFGSTINQSGSGITRGIYINPTLTLASDFRAIDVARGRSIFSGRLSTGKGANVASAGTLTLGDDGNVFHITGTNAITAITTTNWQAGSEVTLIFDSTASITAGANMLLSGAANFNGTANDVIKLVWDGTSWFEVSRSVN